MTRPSPFVRGLLSSGDDDSEFPGEPGLLYDIHLLRAILAGDLRRAEEMICRDYGIPTDTLRSRIHWLAVPIEPTSQSRPE